MAGRGAPTFLKRQKEMKRMQRAQEKRAARQARRDKRAAGNTDESQIEDAPGVPAEQDPASDDSAGS
jgi:hypothetical protein